MKEELKPLLKDWQWQGSVDELLKWWFESENYVDERVIDEIERLKARGIKSYLATKQEKYRTDYLRNEMGLGKVFEKIYSTAEIGHKKLAKEFFQFIIDDLKTKPDEILYFDDDEENVEAAKNIGIVSYLYANFDEFIGQIRNT